VHTTLAGLPFLRDALESAGVVFVNNDRGEGVVRLRRAEQPEPEQLMAMGLFIHEFGQLERAIDAAPTEGLAGALKPPRFSSGAFAMGRLDTRL
jgi:hypothetical protein